MGSFLWVAAAGASVLLSVGVLVSLLAGRRCPSEGQRWGEAALLAATLWVPLVGLPLPRPLAPAAARPDSTPVLTGEIRTPTPPPLVPLEASQPDGARDASGLRSAATAPGAALQVPDDPIADDQAPEATHRPRPFATERAGAVPERNGADPASPAALTAARAWWHRALLGIWVAGAVLLWLRAWWGARLVARIQREATPIAAAVAPGLAREVQRRLGREVRVLVSSRCASPFCSGVRAAASVVVVPHRLLARPDALWPLLAHERAHLMRRDPARRWLLAAAWPVLWWHPMAWWLRRRVLFLAEVEADRAAIAAGVDVRSYGDALLALAEQIPGARTLGVVSAVSSRSELFRRFAMFLRSDSLRAARGPFACLPRAALFGCLVMGGASLWGEPLSAQDPTRPRGARTGAVGLTPKASTEPVGDPVVASTPQDPDPNDAKATLDALKLLLSQRVVSYTVRPGDSLALIAERAGVGVGTLAQLNAGVEPRRLRVGQKLTVPGPGWGVADRLDRLVRDARSDSAETAAATTAPEATAPEATAPEATTPDAMSGAAPDTASARRAQARRSAEVQPGVTLETASLLERYLDAKGRVELDKVRLETVHAEAEGGRATALKLRESEIAYETSRAKLAVLRQVLRSRIELLEAAADQQSDLLKHSKLLAKRGFMTAAEVDRDEQRLRQLQVEIKLIASTL